MRNKKAFTLVELMAVIIIISLIAILTFPNIINQIKKTKESNKKMINDIVISAAKKYVSDNPNEFEEDEYCLPIDTLLDNDYVKEDIVKDIDKKVIHLTFDDNKYEVVDKDKCFLSAVKYLLKKTNPKSITNYTDGNTHEMYTFEHEATEQTPALTDYRYIGSDPYNYVEFNNELWRIIGVFKVEDESGKWEYRLKILKQISIGKMAWDENGSNDWPLASLNTYLNEDYYNSMNNDLKQMAEVSKYYLGGTNSAMFSGNTFYNLERGIAKYGDNSINWNGKIALMYPSDFVYTYALGVDDTCFNNPTYYYCLKSEGKVNSWINISQSYLLSHRLTSGINNYIRYQFEINKASVTSQQSIYPTLYLSSKVKITSGDGSIDNAYKLSM